MLRYLFNRIWDENADIDAIIRAIQPELDALSGSLGQNFYNTFPFVADEGGILRWETMLGIVADPPSEPLDFRRGRVLNRLASTLPYTERMLHSIMDNIIGIGHWNYALDYRSYQLDITALRPGNAWLGEMELTLRRIIPANMLFYLHLFFANWERVRDDFASWGDIYEASKTWQDVMEGT